MKKTKDTKDLISESIPSWWKGGVPSKKASGPRKKIMGSLCLLGFATKKKHLVRGCGSPKFKVNGNGSRTGPSPKFLVGNLGTSKKGQASDSYTDSLTLQNECTCLEL